MFAAFYVYFLVGWSGGECVSRRGAVRSEGWASVGRCAAHRHLAAEAARRGPGARCPHRCRRPPSVRRHAPPRAHVLHRRTRADTRDARVSNLVHDLATGSPDEQPVTSRYLCCVTSVKTLSAYHVRVMDYCGSCFAECWRPSGLGPDIYAPAPLARTRQHARPRGAHRPARVSAPGTDTDTSNRESPFVYVSHVIRRKIRSSHRLSRARTASVYQIVLDSRERVAGVESWPGRPPPTRLCVSRTFAEQT